MPRTQREGASRTSASSCLKVVASLISTVALIAIPVKTGYWTRNGRRPDRFDGQQTGRYPIPGMFFKRVHPRSPWVQQLLPFRLESDVMFLTPPRYISSREEEEIDAQMCPCGKTIERRMHIVGECEKYK